MIVEKPYQLEKVTSKILKQDDKKRCQSFRTKIFRQTYKPVWPCLYCLGIVLSPAVNANWDKTAECRQNLLSAPSGCKTLESSCFRPRAKIEEGGARRKPGKNGLPYKRNRNKSWNLEGASSRCRTRVRVAPLKLVRIRRLISSRLRWSFQGPRICRSAGFRGACRTIIAA